MEYHILIPVPKIKTYPATEISVLRITVFVDIDHSKMRWMLCCQTNDICPHTEFTTHRFRNQFRRKLNPPKRNKLVHRHARVPDLTSRWRRNGWLQAVDRYQDEAPQQWMHNDTTSWPPFAENSYRVRHRRRWLCRMRRQLRMMMIMMMAAVAATIATTTTTPKQSWPLPHNGATYVTDVKVVT
jgi:hypothetical protein